MLDSTSQSQGGSPISSLPVVKVVHVPGSAAQQLPATKKGMLSDHDTIILVQYRVVGNMSNLVRLLCCYIGLKDGNASDLAVRGDLADLVVPVEARHQVVQTLRIP